MRKKDGLDYFVDELATALQDLPMYLDDYERPEDVLREILLNTLPPNVLEAIEEIER